MNILNFCSTAYDNAITEHTETALCKKLKTTHPHDIVGEVCAYCYGADNNLSFTRLIRCKDCQCSFHLECMRTISNEEDTSTCEPSCCYKRDELRKDSVLTQHIRSHTDERPFQCETCQKSFARRDNLTRHLRSHTDERPFQCETCQQTFARRDNLTQHLRSHTGERPFQCETCQKSFAKRDNLTRHLCSHTGEVEFVLDFTEERTLSQQNDAAERISIELVKWSKEKVDAKKGALWYIY